ncbi:helix-hairpin-helix domain-containing protein [Pseudaeromonas sp. ZJS20]|uniref:ComEA family DNA-binding protein n=1 Tax=Pseudaeromonas aegiceratis TaxID=3153928 RepID=UPI00390CA3D2
MKKGNLLTALLLAGSLFQANMALAAEQTTAAAQNMETAALKININQADEAQLMSIKGIGPKRAEAIIAYRSEHGPFTTVDQLAEIKGISPEFVQSHSGELTLE